MSPDLKVLVEEFEKAINESVCESDRVAAVVTDIKRAGYDITLVLEATIGVSACPDSSALQAATDAPQEVHSRVGGNGEIHFSEQDHRFLHALKISSD